MNPVVASINGASLYKEAQDRCPSNPEDFVSILLGSGEFAEADVLENYIKQLKTMNDNLKLKRDLIVAITGNIDTSNGILTTEIDPEELELVAKNINLITDMLVAEYDQGKGNLLYSFDDSDRPMI